ncbi:MAG: DUF4912 domain-containing protein [Chitinispirillaceae bacterium]
MPISHSKSRVVKRFLQKKVRNKSSTKERKPDFAAGDKGPAYTFSTDIPERYDDNYMRAIPRDPQHVYVYWEVSEEKKNEQKRSNRDYAPKDAFLKIQEIIPSQSDRTARRDIHEKQKQIAPVEIPTESRNSLYVEIPRSGKNYKMEYGTSDEKQRFSPTAAAPVFNMAGTGIGPVKAPNPDVDTEFLTNLSYGNADSGLKDSADTLPYMSSPHYSSGKNIQR